MRESPEAALIWQYRGKPRARQTVGLLFSESRETWTSVITLASLLDIDKATGYGLDLIGRHVGLGRTLNAFIPKAYFGWQGADAAQGFGDGVFYRLGGALNDSTRLDDDDYRFLLRARVLKNTQRPTLAAISDAIRYLLGPQAVVIDNLDMSMNIVVPEKMLTPLRLYAVRHLDILVRPVGVRYQLIMIQGERPFGWARDPMAFGFNEGKFMRIVYDHR